MDKVFWFEAGRVVFNPKPIHQIDLPLQHARPMDEFFRLPDPDCTGTGLEYVIHQPIVG